MARRFISAVLCAVILVAGAASCSHIPPQDVITDGASKFSLGKVAEDYSLKDSGDLLKDLIDKYSGSYYDPSSDKMTDDEHDEAKKKRGTQEDSSVPEQSAQESSRQESSGQESSRQESSQQESSAEESSDGAQDEKPIVSNKTDLVRLMRKAYKETAECVEFTASDSFNYNYAKDMSGIYRMLQREDPIAVAGVESWKSWNDGSENEIYINYSFDIDELKRMKKETPQLVKDAVSKIKPRSNSDYDIVDAVNDYLCDTVYYPPDEPYEPVTHTPYGALKNGCAVCEGYACAAKLILNALGVECDIQTGDVTNGGGHAWNIVKVDDKWYQLDITWNDPSPSRHDYFLVTDDFMKNTRTWDESDYPKSARKAYGA